MKEILLKLKNLSHLPKPELEYIPVNELVGDTVSEFSRVSFSPCTVDVSINFDSVLFPEILRNLLRNALESKEKASAAVDISCNSRVTISLQDNGGGIPEDIKDKIFLPGFSTKPGNIGIGLSLVKSLAEEMRIKIEVADTEANTSETVNREKRGTIFNIIVEDYV